MTASPTIIAFSRWQFLPYKLRRSVLKRVAPEMVKDYAFEAPFYGLKYRGNLVNYVDRLVYFCGAYEKYMLQFLADILPSVEAARARPLTFVDVGANMGNHTLFMSQKVSRVHAFEPFAKVRAALEQNLAINAIQNVTVHAVGLGDAAAVLPFYAAPDSNLGAASFVAEHRADNIYLGDLQVVVGDEYFAKAGIGSVDVLKVDVEGFEGNVLKGFNKTLATSRPLILLELSGTSRKNFGSETAFYQAFPKDYAFYYFAKGNKASGQYQLQPFDWALGTEIEDVVAVPNEIALMAPKLFS